MPIKGKELLDLAHGKLVYMAKPQDLIIINGSSGYGKSLFTYSLAEQYHDKGYTIVILTDVKDNFESSFCMFPPRYKWHTDELKKRYRIPSKKKVKIYHPFTFNLPRGKMPDMELFTFPIKSLDRDDIGMLLETHAETESVKLILNVIKRLPRNYGFYEFLCEIGR